MCEIEGIEGFGPQKRGKRGFGARTSETSAFGAVSGVNKRPSEN